jgi:hypothetical protein
VWDERRRRDREQLQARLRGEEADGDNPPPGRPEDPPIS